MYIDEGYLNTLQDTAEKVGYNRAINDVLYTLFKSIWIFTDENTSLVDVMKLKDDIKKLTIQ